MEYRTADRIGRTGLGRLTSKLMMQNDASLPSALGEAIKMKMKATGTRLLSNIDPLNIVRLASFKSPLITTLAGKLMGRSRKDISYFTGNRYGEDLEQESPSKKDKKNDGVYHTRIGPGRLVSVRSGDGLADIMAKLYNLTRHHIEMQMSEDEKKKLFSQEDKDEEMKRLSEMFDKRDSSKAKKIKAEKEIEEDGFIGKLLAGSLGRIIAASWPFIQKLLSVGTVIVWLKGWFKNFIPGPGELVDKFINEPVRNRLTEQDKARVRGQAEFTAMQEFIKDKKPVYMTKEVVDPNTGKKKKVFDKYTPEFVKRVQEYRADPEKMKSWWDKNPEIKKQYFGKGWGSFKVEDITQSKRGVIGESIIKGPSGETLPPTPEPSMNTMKDVQEREQYAVEYMSKVKGWPKPAAEGIVANLSAESNGLDPNAENEQGNYGIAQWDTNRRNKFQQVMMKPIKGSTLQEQLDFVDWELRNTHTEAGMPLSVEQDYKKSTSLILNKFEKPFTEKTTAKEIEDETKRRMDIVERIHNYSEKITPSAAMPVSPMKNTPAAAMPVSPMSTTAPAQPTATPVPEKEKPWYDKAMEKVLGGSREQLRQEYGTKQPEQKLQTQDKVSSLGPRLQTAQNMKNAFESSQGNNVVVAPNNSKIVNNNVMTGGGGGGSPGISIRNDEPALKVAQQKYSMLATV